MTDSEDDHLLRLTTKANKIEFFRESETSSIRCFEGDGDGGFFYGGSLGVWHQDDDGTTELLLELEGFEGTSRPGARDIHLDADQLWIATTFGLYHYDLKSKDYKVYQVEDGGPLRNRNNLNRIIDLQNGQLLLGLDLGLELFDKETKKRTRLQGYQYDQQVNELFQDSKGRIWFGLVFLGLNQYDLNKQEQLEFTLKSGGEIISFIFEDSNGHIWVGTEASGVYRFNESTQSFESYYDHSGLLERSSHVSAGVEDNNGNLWLAGIGGFIKLDPLSGASRLYGSSWGVNTYTMIPGSSFKLSNGELYFGTGSGYYKFHPADLNVPDKKIAHPFINEFYIDEEKMDRSISEMTKLSLQHDENTFSFQISHIDYITDNQDKIIQYQLEGYQTHWGELDSGDNAYFHNIPPGHYTFKIRALDINGKWGERQLEIHIAKPWWQTWWAYALYALGGLLLGWGVHRSQKERTIRIEREKTRERELAQAKEIEKAYDELKATQAQLIHSEKMASLGELTAGIAHEIKNPLNFVNNFSEVNEELIEELLEEIETGDLSEVKKIAQDIRSNETKIQEHGKRADSIVKGMLMHSRANTHEKIPTDVNALCDEYLRLAYHGLRAKDKSFNAETKTNFDVELPEISIIPQDVGRVLLNLFTNAFYTVDKRRQRGNDPSYQPTVSVETRALQKGVIISIKDNGEGMSEEVKSKIFQPFFTTKPTGEGTGLGLSISYDIITKAHEGKIDVHSKLGHGSEFIIEIPGDE